MGSALTPRPHTSGPDELSGPAGFAALRAPAGEPVHGADRGAGSGADQGSRD